ncbi:protein HAIKU1-like [Henckelia pumila]|uniref:protein HAIKU1-like n=1 Tax=Henckelia pumila TaxID=405737 RepID=UPI003C6DEB01
MDDSSNRPPMNRQTPHMGVNKMGKNIKKSPLHQPNFPGTARDQPPPQVYNINKNDFRNLVQQLTGSPLREPPLRPTQNPPKPPNNRLQRIRPPPLAPVAPINRPQIPIHPHLPMPVPAQLSAPLPHPNNFARPPPAQYGQPPQNSMLSHTPSDLWTNTTESPVSAYARYLQNSVLDSGPVQLQDQPQLSKNPQVNGQNMPQPNLLPNPAFPPPRSSGPYSSLPSARTDVLSSPRMNGPPPSHPWMNNHPSPIPSPTSQFLLPSPTGFLNLLSPQSPYPLLSPGYQHPPPISPHFSFSSAAHSGFLGPVYPLHPSPAYGVPLSPGFFPGSSPRWRNQ